jgi:hypothetical protein
MNHVWFESAQCEEGSRVWKRQFEPGIARERSPPNLQHFDASSPVRAAAGSEYEHIVARRGEALQGLIESGGDPVDFG